MLESASSLRSSLEETGIRGLAPGKILRDTPFKHRKIPFVTCPLRCKLFLSFVLFQKPNLLSLEGDHPPIPLATPLRLSVC